MKMKILISFLAVSEITLIMMSGDAVFLRGGKTDDEEKEPISLLQKKISLLQEQILRKKKDQEVDQEVSCLQLKEGSCGSGNSTETKSSETKSGGNDENSVISSKATKFQTFEDAKLGEIVPTLPEDIGDEDNKEDNKEDDFSDDSGTTTTKDGNLDGNLVARLDKKAKKLEDNQKLTNIVANKHTAQIKVLKNNQDDLKNDTEQLRADTKDLRAKQEKSFTAGKEAEEIANKVTSTVEQVNNAQAKVEKTSDEVTKARAEFEDTANELKKATKELHTESADALEQLQRQVADLQIQLQIRVQQLAVENQLKTEADRKAAKEKELSDYASRVSYSLLGTVLSVFGGLFAELHGLDPLTLLKNDAFLNMCETLTKPLAPFVGFPQAIVDNLRTKASTDREKSATATLLNKSFGEARKALLNHPDVGMAAQKLEAKNGASTQSFLGVQSAPAAPQLVQLEGQSSNYLLKLLVSQEAAAKLRKEERAKLAAEGKMESTAAADPDERQQKTDKKEEEDKAFINLVDDLVSFCFVGLVRSLPFCFIDFVKTFILPRLQLTIERFDPVHNVRILFQAPKIIPYMWLFLWIGLFYSVVFCLVKIHVIKTTEKGENATETQTAQNLEDVRASYCRFYCPHAKEIANDNENRRGAGLDELTFVWCCEKRFFKDVLFLSIAHSILYRIMTDNVITNFLDRMNQYTGVSEDQYTDCLFKTLCASLGLWSWFLLYKYEKDNPGAEDVNKFCVKVEKTCRWTTRFFTIPGCMFLTFLEKLAGLQKKLCTGLCNCMNKASYSLRRAENGTGAVELRIFKGRCCKLKSSEV